MRVVKVLVVEDADRLCRAISVALKRSGYTVDTALDGRQGLWMAGSNSYDVIVLDILLPGLDGLALLRLLRKNDRTTHVLLLTAKDSVEDRVRGLQAGADDYLTKPFALEELLARVGALCRRTYGTKNPHIVVADLDVDTVTREVRRAGRRVVLKPREYQLLEYLASRAGELVTRTEIEEHLYGMDADPLSNVVDSAISSLRKKIRRAESRATHPHAARTRLRPEAPAGMTSIRRELRRRVLGGAALLLATGGGSVFLVTRALLVNEFDATLRAQAVAIAGLTTVDEGHIVFDATSPLLAEFRTSAAATRFQLWRQSDLVMIARSPSLGTDDLLTPTAVRGQNAFWNLAGSDDRARATRVVFRPQIAPEEDGERPTATSPELILVVASSRRELDRTLAALALGLVGTGIVLLGSSFFAVPRLLTRALVPLDQLARSAGAVNAASLATRFPAEALPEELAPIARGLNELLTRLEEAFARERRFSADVAHELRTPIAELRAGAELALKWPDAAGPERDQDVLAIAAQMEGIVSRLLSLFRSERGELALTSERVNLSAAVAAAWLRFAVCADRTPLAVSWALADEAWIETDPVLLRSILTNLFENAVTYTPPGGRINVETRLDGEVFAVRVANTTSALMPEDIPRMSERFWRGDRARSGRQHSGLGLSLAEVFADALGARLSLSLAGEMLVVELAGPRVAPSARRDV